MCDTLFTFFWFQLKSSVTLTLGNSYNNINMYSFSKYVRYHEVFKGRKIIIFAIPDIAKCRVCYLFTISRVLLKHRKENGKGLHFIIFNKILFVQRITIYKTINFHLYIIGAFFKINFISLIYFIVNLAVIIVFSL